MPGVDGSAGHRAELHFHLLPGVDDGPADMAQTLDLARRAVADGTRTIVATPHVCDVDPDELPERVEEVARHLAEARIPIDVLCGGEIAFDDPPRLRPDHLRTMSCGPVSAPWVLLEGPLEDRGASADDLAEAAGALRSEGFGILLGHPERSRVLCDGDFAGLRRELAAGAVPQVNATSVLGAHGPRARERALDIARMSPRALVASDAHGPVRGPCLGAARQALMEAGIPWSTARAMTDTRPVELLRQGTPHGARRPPHREAGRR